MDGLFIPFVLTIVSDLYNYFFFENKYRKYWSKPVDFVQVYTPGGGSPTTKKYITHQWVAH